MRFVLKGSLVGKYYVHKIYDFQKYKKNQAFTKNKNMKMKLFINLCFFTDNFCMSEYRCRNKLVCALTKILICKPVVDRDAILVLLPPTNIPPATITPSAFFGSDPG